MVNEAVVLSVFFCGSNDTIDSGDTQISTFEGLTIAQDLTDPLTEIQQNETQFKMSFDGCGEAFGMRGMIFGYGLEQQCDQVVSRVNALLDQGKKVKLNCLGLSRGGVAELFLIQKLKSIDRYHLEINALIFDPVPGNLITSRKLDFSRQTTANKAMDVSDSKNLNDVIAIYPATPLKNYEFHAPIIPLYPCHTSVKNIVIPGCHQSALGNCRSVTNDANDYGSVISHYHIYHFLQDHGTALKESKLLVSHKGILAYMQFQPASSSRPTHNRHGLSGLRIEAISKPDGYMSREHYRMHHDLAEDEAEPVDIEFNMRFKPDLPWKLKPEMPDPSKQILLEFAIELKKTVTQKSETKASHLQVIIDYMTDKEAFSVEQACLILRDVLALALQRERNAFSLWTYSTTGLKALSLLKLPKFVSLKLLVQPIERLAHYKDLREFILGTNTPRYFTEQHRDDRYLALDIAARYQTKEDVTDSYQAIRANK